MSRQQKNKYNCLYPGLIFMTKWSTTERPKQQYTEHSLTNFDVFDRSCLGQNGQSGLSAYRRNHFARSLSASHPCSAPEPSVYPGGDTPPSHNAVLACCQGVFHWNTEGSMKKHCLNSWKQVHGCLKCITQYTG